MPLAVSLVAAEESQAATCPAAEDRRNGVFRAAGIPILHGPIDSLAPRRTGLRAVVDDWFVAGTLTLIGRARRVIAP